MQTYVQIFFSAAIPQRLVFLALLGAVVVSIVVAMNRRFRGRAQTPPSFIAQLGVLCPAVGLLVAGWNVVHIMQTALMLPRAPTLKMLAPGFMEIAALIEAGALAGLICVVVNGFLEARGADPALKP